MDPIEAPGTSPTAHLHVFFGNMVSGTSSFPSIKSGDNGGTGVTMENNGLSPQTNCEDNQDTAGYWVPEPYFNHVAWLGPNGVGCSSNCNIINDMYRREYYLPSTVSSATQAHPFPRSYPIDTHIVRYICGASQGSAIATPASAWPYNCATYRDPDDSFDDGIQAIVSFPDCWNGRSDWPAPNDPQPEGAGLRGTMDSRPERADKQQCPAERFRLPAERGVPEPLPHPVLQLGQRTHLLKLGNAGNGFGEPSSCIGDGGHSWNDPASNAEWNDGDGFTPHTCSQASRPSSNITLSFSCGHGGDPNCTYDTGQTGCASSNGDCYIGVSPFGWETLHADYRQTWQEGNGQPTGAGTDNFPDSAQGALRDLIEDCSTEGTGTCGFITNSAPTGRVYGNPENT